MSSFWPLKKLPSPQPHVTVLPRAFLGIVRLRPLTPHRAWCFPTHMILFMLFATWDVQILLVKSYVNPMIVIIFSFFKDFFLLSKKYNAMKGVGRGGQ